MVVIRHSINRLTACLRSIIPIYCNLPILQVFFRITS
nr:MAG TPA_asm: hypothetical protein [Caudoviricetes sp.]